MRVLFTDHDVLGDIVFGNKVMEKAFIDQHPQAVKEFVTASVKAADWAAEHPDEARKLVAQILKKRGDNPAAAAAEAYLLAGLWPAAARAVQGQRYQNLARRAVDSLGFCYGLLQA